MGITRTNLRLSNPVESRLAPLECQALADTGAIHLCVPEYVALQLGLSLTSQEPREVTLADGSKRSVPYVGPIRVQFENRSCFVGGLVMGDEVLLGAIPMEDMDLIVRPLTREVAVNPANPNIASSLAKDVLRGGLSKALIAPDALAKIDGHFKSNGSRPIEPDFDIQI